MIRNHALTSALALLTLQLGACTRAVFLDDAAADASSGMQLNDASVGSGSSSVGSGGSSVGSVGGGGEELPACAEDRAAPVAPIDDAITVRIAAFDFVTFEVPEQLEGKVCLAGDTDCRNAFTSGVAPDSDGMLTFDGLPAPFEGYFELTAPSIVTTLVFSNRRFSADTVLYSIALVTPEGLGETAQRGIVVADVRDCAGAAAPGVVLELEGSTQHPAYFVGTYPDRDVDETMVSTSLNPSGTAVTIGVFSDLEAGEVTIMAFENEHLFGEVIALVRDATLTYAFLYEGN